MASKLLTDLLAKRAQAFTDYEKIAAEYRDNTAPTDEQTAGYTAARDLVKQIDERIGEVEDEETRNAAYEETRKRLLGDTGTDTSPAVVLSEPRTYGEGSGNSYFADLCWSAMPGDRHYLDAQQRLSSHGKEIVRDAVNDVAARQRLIKATRENFRDDQGRAQRAIAEIEGRSLEVRAMDTTSGSGGSFVTPQYLVSDYAPYRSFGRTFIDEANVQDLPEYGMTVYLPAVSAGAGISGTTTQNTAVTESDPTAGYLSNNLITESGQVTISQQLLDRAGPGVEFDKIVFDQLQRAYNTSIDTAVLTAALANAGTVTDTATGTTGTAFIQDFYADVAQATQQMETASGTVLSPTHLFATNVQWSFLSSLTDSNGRPFLVPSYAGPYNAIAAAINGKEMKVPEGETGFDVQSLPVFKDGNVPLSSTNQQMVVAHMPEVWVWEGNLIPRTIPQTYAQNLSVLLQVYTYYTVIVRYSKAVQAISGSRWAGTPTFIRA